MQLFEHQKTGIQFLKEKRKCILADEMGLGKTRQAIIAAKESATGSGNILVVCPASLKINWKREIESTYPDAEVRILTTTDYDPPAAIGRWYVVNYDILEKKMAFIDNLIRVGLKTLILDEAHYIKGKSKRSACIVGGPGKKGIAELMENVYCVTGTPLLNRPIELFNLMRAIGHPLGSNRSAFAKRYCNAFFMVRILNLQTGQAFMTSQDKAYKYYMDRAKFKHTLRFLNEQGASNLDELEKHLRGWMLRRKKKDVLNLPAKIITNMECEMTPEWKRKYESAWDDYIAFLEENPSPDKNLDNILIARQLVELQKLKQVLSLSKVERIVEDVRNAVEQGQKVIVFSQYTETIKRISESLATRPKGGEPVKNVTLTGTDDMDSRQRAVDTFQKDPDTMAFIANIKAGGVGLTLTEASIVMFADMEWSPETHAQAEDRAHRIGQTGTVNVYYYVTRETIEDDIIAILEEKKDVMNQILEGKKPAGKQESMQEALLKKLSTRDA